MKIKKRDVHRRKVREEKSKEVIGPVSRFAQLDYDMQVWSNGRFQSSDHRVVVNRKSNRISMVYVFGAPRDFVVQCPPELVDEAHPSLYIPYTYEDYRANFERLLQNGIVGRKDTLAFALRNQ